jgi:hypothetical protein
MVWVIAVGYLWVPFFFNPSGFDGPTMYKSIQVGS